MSTTLLGRPPHDSSESDAGLKLPAANPAPAPSRTASQAQSAPASAEEPPPESAGEDAAAEESPRRSWSGAGAALFRDMSYTMLSAAIHMVGLIAASLIFSQTVEYKVEGEAPSFAEAEIPEEPELEQQMLKFELEKQLATVTQRTSAMVSSSPIIGEIGGSGPAGIGGGGSGSIASPTMDRGLLEQVGTGTGGGIDIGGIFLDAPSANKMIVEAPDGQIGQARAVVGSYQEALDRMTQEFLWMLDKGKVLVIWCFDESESMKDDQKEIRDRIEHVYDELGILHKGNSDALETAVVSFGEKFAVRTSRPTHDRAEISLAIDSVPVDKSGKEMTCSTVIQALAIHRAYAQRTQRQLAMIVVTDESGDRIDNDSNLERAIADAKAARCKVYVLGRESVFGYPYAHMRWVHPQTKHVHWLRIDRGPESAFVEQLQTDGFHRRYDAHPAGFGPFEVTRIAQETGGIFFLLPSVESDLVRGEKRDYQLEAMQAYLPDMRSKLEVKADIDRSPMRAMLEKVIYDLNPYNPEAQKIIEMRVEFSKEPEAFVRQARQEQAKAIVYLQYLAKAEKEVAKFERQRRNEASPRWQANYDLLYAQLVAYQARMYEYGAYLEEFIKKPKPNPPLTKAPNLTWIHWDIRTRHEIITGEKVQPYIDRASAMFKDVIAKHPGTPWSARAELELKRGFGVELIPDYHAPDATYSGTLMPIPKL